MKGLSGKPFVVTGHSGDVYGLLKEIHRVLKLSGIFIMQVPNIAWILYRVQLLFGKLPTTGGVYLGADWEHLHNFAKITLCRLLTENRF